MCLSTQKLGLPRWLGRKESCQCRRHKFNPCVGRIPRRNGNLSSILAYKISWTEEPIRLQSMKLQKSQTGFCNSTTTHKLIDGKHYLLKGYIYSKTYRLIIIFHILSHMHVVLTNFVSNIAIATQSWICCEIFTALYLNRFHNKNYIFIFTEKYDRINNHRLSKMYILH